MLSQSLLLTCIALSTEKDESRRDLAHECLGEVLRVLRQVIATYPMLNTVETLTAAGTLISKVKGQFQNARPLDNSWEPSVSFTWFRLSFNPCIMLRFCTLLSNWPGQFFWHVKTIEMFLEKTGRKDLRKTNSIYIVLILTQTFRENNIHEYYLISARWHLTMCVSGSFWGKSSLIHLNCQNHVRKWKWNCTQW